MSLNVNSNFTPNYPNLSVSGAISSASAQITTLTASNIAITNNLSVAGTLTTVNMTTTNLIDTNITAGSANITNATIATARITSNLLALGNSNTLGNLFTTGGNVGIGTTAPSCLLTIQGPSAAGQTTFVGDAIEIGGGRSSDGVAYIDFHTAEATYGDYSMRLIRESGANGASTLGHRGTGPIQYICQDAGAQIWATSNTERMRLTAGGNVGIGTATPGSLLCLNGTTTANGMLQVVSSNVGGKLGDGAAFQASNDSNTIINFLNVAGSIRGYINGNSSSVNYSTSSDIRLKTNVQDMPSMIDKIKELKPRTYNWIADNEPASGFIAQEIHQTFPEFRVNRYPESDPENPVDEEGRPWYYGLDYGKLTPYLTKGLQETIAKVESQETYIQALEARLAALEQK